MQGRELDRNARTWRPGGIPGARADGRNRTRHKHRNISRRHRRCARLRPHVERIAEFTITESSISEANTLRELGRRDEAATLAEEAEALLRRLDDEPLLFRALDLRARMALEEGRWADAERLANESLMTARSAGVRAGLTLPLGTLGMARRELGNMDGRGPRTRRRSRSLRSCSDPLARATAQANLAAVDIATGDLQGALRRYAVAEPVLAPAGAHGMLVPILNNRWQVHMQRGDAASAIVDLRSGAASAGFIGAVPQQHQMLTKGRRAAVRVGPQRRGGACVGRTRRGVPATRRSTGIATGCRRTGAAR